MTVLVTGGTGFVGRSLVEGLLSKGYRVRCIVREPRKAERLLPSSVERVTGDILEPQGLAKAALGCQAIAHLVGIIRETLRTSFESIHVEGMRNVVGAAREAGVRRFLHMSALGSRPDAESRYHRTKYRAEAVLRESGLAYTIFRPSVIFGPGDQFINRLAQLIRLSPIIPIPGDGRGRIQPVFIGDVVECFLLGLAQTGSIGKSYDLGGPRSFSIEETVDAVLGVMNRRRLKIHIPIRLLEVMAFFFEKGLPVPPLTRDQLILLQEDNICGTEAVRTDLGLHLTDFVQGIRSYI